MEIVQGLFATTETKKPLYSLPAEKALIMPYPWISVYSRRWFPARIRAAVSVTDRPLQVGRCHRLLWSWWRGNKLCICYTLIIPLVPPNLLGFKRASKKTSQDCLLYSKMGGGGGVHRPCPCMSDVRLCEDKRLTEPSRFNIASFFYLSTETFPPDICVGFPSRW